MVAFMVDVGDAEAVVKHARRIRQHHYQGAPLHVQSILSTHKHHDHTAGNIDLCRTRIGPATKINASDTSLVERLMWYPAAIILCNYPLANGDKKQGKEYYAQVSKQGDVCANGFIIE
jgi:glyoxylase-like metal-dependent hydrolase (beta-lactamase superfamily II)